jgi:hypothetical protein
MGITIRNTGQGGTIRFTSLGLGGTFNSVYVAPSGTTTTTTTTAGLLLLDTYSGAAVAFSLRKLNSSYSGNAIRVRRSNDNAEQDIGFVNNQLDTASLSSFVSSNSAFITRWYDQSGNNVTASQATAGNQPRIVNAGTIDSQGGKPSMWFVPGSTNSFTTTTNVAVGSYMSTFIVSKLDLSTGGYKYLASIGAPAASSNFYCVILAAGGGFQDWAAGDAIALGTGYNTGLGPRVISNGDIYSTLYKLSSVFLGSANTGYYVNGSAISTKSLVQGNADSNNTTNPLVIGSGGGTDVHTGYLSELIIYRSNQSANRSGIESNINTNYSIY